jgi:tetrahydromethanopterin S-methyltransferase subunit H
VTIVWSFAARQRVVQVGGVNIGGIPGERPVVLVGTVFYRGHRVITNEGTSAFNKDEAEALINVQDEFSEKTGNPSMIDIVGTSSEILNKELDFVTTTTDAPVLIDSPSMDVRLEGIRHAKEVGLIERVVYNSIVPNSKPEELRALKELELKSSILLSYNPDDPFTVRARMDGARKLLSMSDQIGIDKPLIDTCVLDVPTLGVACRTLWNIKNETGFPVGAGTHNAVATWRGLKKKLGKYAVEHCTVAAAVTSVNAGADFVLYGPIEYAKSVFPAVAMVDVSYGQLTFEQGKRPVAGHPFFKVV